VENQLSDANTGSGRRAVAAPTIEPMSLERGAWLATVLVALLTAMLVALEGYTGYAFLSVAVGASAAINLF
jgi:hypothetical protein